MQKPVERTFVVDCVIGEGMSRRGDPFIEVRTSLGTVAFWGSERNQKNLETIRSAQSQSTITCGCISPSAGYVKRHAFWVPEMPLISTPVPARLPGPASGLRRWPNAQVLASDFPRWLDLFDSAGPFRKSGQLEWHRKTIDRRLGLGSGAAAVRDPLFLKSLYATLQAWGIGSRESKIRPYEAFAAELRRHQRSIEALEAASIDDEQLDVLKVSEELWALLGGLMIVENKAKVVSGTKALHHILPNLVVPMDRKYTQVFFGWQNPKFQYGQRECFIEAFEAFVHVARCASGSLCGVGVAVFSNESARQWRRCGSSGEGRKRSRLTSACSRRRRMKSFGAAAAEAGR